VAPSGEQIEIVGDGQRAVVVEVGGGLRSYSVDGVELLDGYPQTAMCTSGRGQLLIPWPNRLQGGTYEFDGRRHRLPLTEPDRGNAIHGLVRWSLWTVAERASDGVVVRHVIYPQPGYPFEVEVRVHYELLPTGLIVTTTATNVGAEACPYGNGAHPYLTLGTPTVDSIVLHAPGRSVLVSDDDGIPTGRVAVAGTEYDFLEPRPIGGAKLDNAYTELERNDAGVASVDLQHETSGAGVTVWVDATYRYVMLFSGDPLPDVNRRSLAVEPMTCPPKPFRTGQDVVRLEPGASFTSTWGIAPRFRGTLELA
jgi:aldose 1-epimerase